MRPRECPGVTGLAIVVLAALELWTSGYHTPHVKA